MANRITSLCIDCADPEALATFWTEVLGWQVTEREDGDVVRIEPQAGASFAIDFLRVPDGPKKTKNRLHLDLNATDRDQGAELARLRDLGAVQIDIGQGEVTWEVLADPEGNEFCLLRRRVAPV
jgi:catechol 2,3-dioxygenase-like lactoylglutathione lyase family enzyme